MTNFVIEALDEVNAKFKTTIITGLGYPFISDLKNILKLVQYQYELFQNPNNVAEIMSIADLAIISFGVTAYELASLSVPALYLCLSSDHEKSSRLFEKENIGKTMGVYSDIDKKKFIQTLSSFIWNQKKINTMSKKAISINVSSLEKISSSIFNQTVYG